MKPKSKLLTLMALLVPIVILSFEPKPGAIKKLAPSDITSVTVDVIEPHCIVDMYRFTANGSNAASYDWQWRYAGTGSYVSFHTGSSNVAFYTLGDQTCDQVDIIVIPYDSGNNPGNTFGPFQSDNCCMYDDPDCNPLTKSNKPNKSKIIRLKPKTLK